MGFSWTKITSLSFKGAGFRCLLELEVGLMILGAWTLAESSLYFQKKFRAPLDLGERKHVSLIIEKVTDQS